MLEFCEHKSINFSKIVLLKLSSPSRYGEAFIVEVKKIEKINT